MDIIQQSELIVQEYAEQGYKLTLRQLYYQFVSRAWLPNGQKHYNRIKSTLAKARLDAMFPLDALVDRSRTVNHGDFDEWNIDVDRALRQAGESVQEFPNWYLNHSRWIGQPKHVSLWVEKEALSGIVERPCENAGVSWFCTKGYPSHASLHAWLERAVQSAQPGSGYRGGEFIETGAAGGYERELVILYMGDHDPDGLQIPISAEDVLRNFMEQMGVDIKLTVDRIALNADQIERFNPPPFPAKPTSSRFKSYVEATGLHDAWELDALSPPDLANLIERKIDDHFDHELHDELHEVVFEAREEMRERMGDGWVEGLLT